MKPGPNGHPGLLRSLGWLRAGARDWSLVPLASSLHGLLFLVFALAIMAIGWRDSGVLAGAFSGFVLVAPVLVTGFHELSRRIESGETRPRRALLALLAVWRRSWRQLAAFGLLLALIGSIWVAFSTMLVRLSLGGSAGLSAGADPLTGGAGVAAFLRQFVVGSDGWHLVWFLAGGLVAAVVFAISALSVPMLVDRDVRLGEAIRASVAAAGRHPLEMVGWAAMIMLLVLIGSLTLIGLVVVVPLLGHATWHAYRDIGPARLPAAGA